MKKNEICAVIVTYNPEMNTLNYLIENIYNSVDLIIVIDNGTSNFRENFDMSIKKDFQSKIKVLINESNMGLAFAQNQGIEFSVKNNYKYTIIFDQDSKPNEDMIDNLVNDFEVIFSRGIKIAAIGPTFLDSRTDEKFPFINFHWYGTEKFNFPHNSSKAFGEVDLLISSGSLILNDSLGEIGFMDENLFIDLIDVDWSFRAISKGYKIYGTSSARMYHTIGDNIKKIWLGRFRNILIHSTTRRYYMVRNQIILMKKSYVPFRWKFYVFNKLIISNIMYIIFVGEKRREYLKSMISGMKNGVLFDNNKVLDFQNDKKVKE